MGSDKDPTWIEFPQALTSTIGARQYVSLFEGPFVTYDLSESENTALRAISLLVVPTPPPEVHPLAGLPATDLPEANLTQWASYVQDVASGMRKMPQAAENCPMQDIVGVLHHLEKKTSIKFCHLCFGVGNRYRCSKAPPPVPGQGLGLWLPPIMSQAALSTTTMTTASSSVAVVLPMGFPSPGLSPGFPTPMDNLPASPRNLLATASVGRELRPPAAGPQTPTAPGPHQLWPSAIQQRISSSGWHKAGQATPY